MTTLRRELRTKFEEVIRAATLDEYNDIALMADRLTDIALEVSGIAKRAVSADFEKTLPADWKIAAGLDVSEADLAAERNVSLATEEFERALLVKIPWGKESKFQKWVSEQFAKDSTCFARYAKWQKDDPFKSLSAKQIRHTPQEFMDTWPSFEAMLKPKAVSDALDPEIERLRAEAKQTWAKPPERGKR